MFLSRDNVPAVLVPWIDWIVRLLFILYPLLLWSRWPMKRPCFNWLAHHFSCIPVRYPTDYIVSWDCAHVWHGSLGKAGLSVPVVMRVFLFLAINYLVAGLSYRVIESPFLKLKDKLRRI